MKRPLLILSACLCALAAAVSCSSGLADRRRTIRPGPGDGRIPPLSGDGRPVPRRTEGYETFYISHYGRHGSRYLLYDSQYAFVRDVLSRAAADGKLTPSGQKALADFLEAYPQFEGRAGMLTESERPSTGRSPEDG